MDPGYGHIALRAAADPRVDLRDRLPEVYGIDPDTQDIEPGSNRRREAGQNAFWRRNTATTVRKMIFRSSHSDQFSM